MLLSYNFIHVSDFLMYSYKTIDVRRNDSYIGLPLIKLFVKFQMIESFYLSMIFDNMSILLATINNMNMRLYGYFEFQIEMSQS